MHPPVSERFEFNRLLGQGGHGSVYQARDTVLNRSVAIKILDTAQLDRGSVVKEAKLLADLDHPSVVKVFSVELFNDSTVALVMELIEGQDAASVLMSTGRYSCDDVLSIAKQACEALSYCHRRGVLHRDLKPDNFIIQKEATGNLRVKIIDFGIAKESGAQAGGTTSNTGLVGSPNQMSPEVCQGKRATVQSEIYSLGCTLFELASNRPPYEGQSPMSVIVQHATARPPDLSSVLPSTDRSPVLEQVVSRCLQKDPFSRFSNMDAMLTALSADEISTDGEHEEGMRAGFAFKSKAALAVLLCLSVVVAIGAMKPAGWKNGHENAAKNAHDNRSALRGAAYQSLKFGNSSAALMYLFQIVHAQKDVFREPDKKLLQAVCASFASGETPPTGVDALSLSLACLSCARDCTRLAQLDQKIYWYTQVNQFCRFVEPLRGFDLSVQCVQFFANQDSISAAKQLDAVNTAAMLLGKMPESDSATYKLKDFCDSLLRLKARGVTVDSALEQVEAYLRKLSARKSLSFEELGIIGTSQYGRRHLSDALESFRLAMASASGRDVAPQSKAHILVLASACAEELKRYKESLALVSSALALRKQIDDPAALSVITTRYGQALVRLELPGAEERFCESVHLMQQRVDMEIRARKFTRAMEILSQCDIVTLDVLEALLANKKTQAVRKMAESELDLWRRLNARSPQEKQLADYAFTSASPNL